MMGWVGSGEDFCGLGPEILGWVGLGFEKVTHDQLWAQPCANARRLRRRSPRVSLIHPLTNSILHLQELSV